MSSGADGENKTWPTASGITEEGARAACESALRGSQLYSEGDDSSDVMAGIADSCVLDIMYLDSYDVVEGSVAAFTDDLQTQMLQDVNNYNTDDQGELVLKSNVSNVCSTACFRHGTCVNGSCACLPGYTGSTCQLVQGEPPRLLGIRGSSVCDVNQRPCRKIFMDAEGFEGGDLFLCRVQEIMDVQSSDGLTSSFTGNAQFITDARLACPLPDAKVKSERSVRTFAVSFTYDGITYSNALNVTVFDSTCQDCDVMSCQRKPHTCLINDLCYVDGDVKPDDESKICDTSLSTSQWSDVRQPSSSPALSQSVMFGIVLAALGSRFASEM